MPGLETCNADGTRFGPCDGQVTPVAETCGTTGDDDCDGLTNERGPDCVCVPGSQVACYSGPPATENVGPCMGGSQQCNATGDGYGPCIGEIVPQLETCNTPVDDDCDGITNEEGVGCVCAPATSATCYTGPPGTENVGVCQAGTNVCNAQGTAWGPCIGEVTPSADLCPTAADEDCSGSPVPCQGAIEWSHAYGQSGGTTAASDPVAVDAAGNVLLAVEIANSVDFGGGALSGATIVKLDPAGAHIWSKGFPQAISQGVAVDGAGNVLLTGIAYAAVDFGGGAICGSGAPRAYLVKLSPGGNHVWSKCVAAGSFAQGSTVVADGTGNLLWAGGFVGTMDFGNGPLVSPGIGLDAFVVKLSPAGTVLWSRHAASTSATVASISVKGSSSVVASGRFATSAAFGGQPVTAAGPNDLYLVEIDSNGGVATLKGYGGGDHVDMWSAVDGSDNVLLAGQFRTSLDLGGGMLAGVAAGGDAFAAKLDPSGNHVWSKSFASGQLQGARGIAADPFGNVLLTGGFAGNIDLGTGALTSTFAVDVFVAKLGPTGNGIWSKSFGWIQDQWGLGIAADPAGAPVFAGHFYSEIDLGQGWFFAQGDPDAFIAKQAP